MNIENHEPSPVDGGANHVISRRRAMLATVAASAALSGVGVAWWLKDSASEMAVAMPVDGFWTMRWETPFGQWIDMAAFKGQPLLLNFWATWCPPCVDELPLIDAFYQENKAKGWNVLGLAVDRLQPVQSFLKSFPLSFPVGMAGMAGAEFGRSLGNLSGGLPYSVVIGAQGGVLQRKMGRLNAADFESWNRLK